MHLKYTTFLTAIFSLLPPSTALPYTAPSFKNLPRNAAPELHQPAIMTAISEHTLSSLLGLRRRDLKLSDLDLKDQAQMIYGTPGANGMLQLANVTLQAPSGKKLVMMERFEGLTTAIDCAGEDGEMSLTFEDAGALGYAEKAWDSKTFIMIANHDGCVEKDQRKAYEISKVTIDSEKLSAVLASKPIDWREVTGTFTIDFGKASLKTTARRIRRSAEPEPEAAPGIGDFFKKVGNKVKETAKKAVHKTKAVANKAVEKVKGVADKALGKTKEVVEKSKDKAEEIVDKTKEKTKDVVEDIKEGAKKAKDKADDLVDDLKDKSKEFADKIKEDAKANLEKAKAIAEKLIPNDGTADGDFTLDLSAGSPGKRFPIFTDQTSAFPNLAIACSDCHSTGKIHLSGRASIVDFRLTSLTFDARTTDLGATLALEIFARKAETEDVGPNFTFEADILTLPLPGGLVIPALFSAGPTLAFKAGIDSALVGTLNGTVGARVKLSDAEIHADLLDVQRSTASGGEASIEPVFALNQLTGAYKVGVFAAPTLGLGFDVMGVFGFEAQLRFQTPRISAGLDVGFKEGGFCAGEKAETGVSVSASVGTSVVFAVKQASGGVVGGSLFEKMLFEKSAKLGGLCVPLLDL